MCCSENVCITPVLQTKPSKQHVLHVLYPPPRVTYGTQLRCRHSGLCYDLAQAMAQPRIAAADRGVIIHLMENGYSAAAAARETGRDRRTVALWWRRHNEEGHANRHHGGGNRRSTSAEEDARIVEYARTVKFVTAAQIKAALGLDCSLDTIRR